MITTVLFIISAASAIPTFGISLVVFFIGKSLWDRLCAEQIAKHIYLSAKSGGTVYTLQRINGAAIRRFFDRLGTQVPRYTFDTSLGTYVGEVHLPGVGVVLATVTRTENRIGVAASEPPPRISVEGLLDGSFEKSLDKWLDTSIHPATPRPVPASSAPKNETVTRFITTRETRKGWQVVWMRAADNGFEPYRSGAGFYKTQKEAQIELELWADEGLPIR